MQPNRLWSRHIGSKSGVLVWGAIPYIYDNRNTLVVITHPLTPNLYVSLAIQPVALPFMNMIQRGAFQLDNVLLYTAVVIQHALKGIDLLPWSVRSPNLSPIELNGDIIGRQLHCHPH
ncbi:uncharacterized protein TNCV_4261571 [Trichonephila clavipes]|nr:uncharacterized protein TNCV_4261571 [Trichonephila clavipes]